MNIENSDKPEIKENNFQNFFKLEQHVVISGVANTDSPLPHAAPTIDELFEFLEKHFEAYRDISNLKAVLPFVHLSLRLYARRDYLHDDIGIVLHHFYEDHKEEENDLMIFVQILHQVLYSLDMYDNKEITFSRKVFIQLVKQLPTLTGRTIVSNIIACLQLYMKMFPGNNEIIQILWTDLSQRLQTAPETTKTGIDILMQLFDDFYHANPNLHSDATLVATIQHLLKSNLREERKCGYFLFKKMIQGFIATLQNINSIFLPPEHAKQVERMWTFYITILENLEENQSHLILPSLDNLNELIDSKKVQSSWLEILFCRILKHKNKLVLRWSIEFFMDKFTSATLHKDVLKHLLEAINSNVLYNHEGYFIDQKYFSSFLMDDSSGVYKELGEINWKSVPLSNLLNAMSKGQPPKAMSFEQVLKIASRVRNLTDIYIRRSTASALNRHLQLVIDKMTIEEYVTYAETLFTATDRCDVFESLFKKRPVFDMEKPGSIFQRRFYEIALANLDQTNLKMLICFLDKMPVLKHGWLRFLPFHFGQLCVPNEKELQKLKSWYGVSLDSFNVDPSLENNRRKFARGLCHNMATDEIEQCKIAVIAIYINNLDSLDNLDEESYKHVFLYKLPEQSVRKLCHCLDKTTQVLESSVIFRFIELLSCNSNYDEYHSVCSYLEKHNLCDEYIEVMLEKCPRFLKTCNTNILKYLNRPDFFCDDIKKGESRIEECYRYNIMGQHTMDTSMRVLWHSQLRKFGDYYYALYLLNCHKEISKKKQRYFANSYEHRIKMRIAWGMASILKNIHINESMFNEFWNIILNENNQLNITYFYEYVISTRDNRKQSLLQKLTEAHNLTSSQQISIMSVVYNFCMWNLDVDESTKEVVVTNLIALTMGANFHTRLFAQMVLFNLLKSEHFSMIQCSNQILQSIETATKQTLDEHLYDIRLYLYSFKSAECLWDIILYVTKAPYDEIVRKLNLFNFPEEMESRVVKCRNEFSKKAEMGPKDVQDISDKETGNNQLQRKMNPSMDVIEPNNLLMYPMKEANAEMFVIASLIDKLPNLGGIARTCEVLGIRNMVMDSKKDIEKNDFKNLSMTAEKSLNIIEVKQKDLSNFIINKQKEGFAVVGAEQTSSSKNFANFKFPEKSILLLGHEKDGIPPTLLGLLDHAVEIPQCGQVRSLNVHVTGALFMWEYCKQHLVQ